METKEFRELISILGYSQAAFARHIEVSPRAVYNWSKGIIRIPKSVELYLRLLKRIKEFGDV